MVWLRSTFMRLACLFCHILLKCLILPSMILYASLMLRHFSTFVDCFPRKFYTIFIHFLNHCMSHYLSPTATPHKYTPKKQVKILFIKAFSPVLNLIAPLNSLSVSRQSHVTPAPAKSYSPLRFFPEQ